MSDDYRQRLIDALGELAWTLDAQGRKADSLTCTKAAIQLSAEPEAATNRNAVIMPLEPTQEMINAGAETINHKLDPSKQAALVYRYMIGNRPETEATALLRIWLKRLDYSDPHGDKPLVKAYLDKCEPQKDER